MGISLGDAVFFSGDMGPGAGPHVYKSSCEAEVRTENEGHAENT